MHMIGVKQTKGLLMRKTLVYKQGFFIFLEKILIK